MNTRITFNSVAGALAEILRQYDEGYTYVAGSLNGVDFKVRMNKNHGMKDHNNSHFEHVLSLVNGDCDTCHHETVLGYWIVQKRTSDREEAEYEITEFLEGLADYEESN